MSKYQEQIVYTATLAMPPSVNESLMSVDGRLIKTYVARQWQATALRHLRSHGAAEALKDVPYNGLRILVELYFTSRRQMMDSDVDNRLKAAQDAVCMAMNVNDKLVFDSQVRRAGVDEFGSRKAVVTVVALIGDIGDIADGLGGFYATM